MGFVENINIVAQGLTVEFIESVESIKPISDEIVIVADNIADINSVANTVVPNMTEILMADDNAAIATTKAAEALASANNARASELAAAASESQIASHLIDTSNPHSVTKAQVGLGNVDNTSDINKPVSTSVQTALDTKADSVAIADALALKADLVDGKIPQGQLPSYVDDILEYANFASFPAVGESSKIYIAIDTNRSYRWSGSAYVDITGMVDSVAGKTGAVTLVKGDVGLGNVDNTSDSAKPVSVAQQAALNLKANLDSPIFTGTVAGITKSMVGLSNVDNTSDTDKPVSTAVQSALNLKQDSSTAVQKDSSTGAMYMPYGTTAQRPSSPSTGYMRFNTDLGKAEVWNGSVWSGVGGGATGGGSDTVFVETSYAVTQNYTITVGKSAITVGDANGNVSIADGVTVTIPDGSIWVVQGV